jgi:hypothetical protein
MADRIIDFDSSFIKGVNSSFDPSQLPLGYVWNAINTINVAGVISCRPGHKCIAKLPKGNLQGASIFRPRIGLEQILAAVDGIIYVATYPFTVFNVLEGVKFRPEADQIFFMQTVQSARRLTPGDLASAIEVIEPRAVIFMQDGGFTAPAWYDGSKAGHIKGIAFETPTGGPMEWVGDRLWIANGSQVFASDISNPFSFVEQIYLGGTVGFNFSRDVTAMVKTPNIEFPQLLVYTDEDTSLIEASLRDRSKWPTTDGFQKEILQVGCTGDRAVTSHFGRLLWFSSGGLVIYDAATARGWTSRSPLRDNEMLVSKKTLNEDLSKVAMGAFGQWLLISVPAEDVYNKHTWIFNNASFETISDEGGPTWSGFWLGTRPVEWIYGVIAGAERIYHVSIDQDGENRLWQSFRPEQLDNGCPIMWAIETRGYFGLTSPAKKLPDQKCQYGFSDVGLTGVGEPLDFGVFVAPGVRGEYVPIMAKRINVTRGSIRYDQEITATTSIFAYKPQSRIERTQEFSNPGIPEEESGSCPVESKYNDDNEESFQMLIVGHGPASIRFIRSFALLGPEEKLAGDAAACVDEVGTNIVRFDGVAIADGSEDIAVTEISAKRVIDFTSVKTASVTYNGITAAGVGMSESIVSQEAADRVAEIIATKFAETEISQASAPFLSVGLGFDE